MQLTQHPPHTAVINQGGRRTTKDGQDHDKPMTAGTGTTMKQGHRDKNDEEQEEGGEDEGRRWQGQKEQGNNNSTDKDKDNQG